MPVNIEIPYANFSHGPPVPVPGLIYFVDFNLKLLKAVTPGDGTLAASYIVTRAQLRNPVKELHYDGTFFWTLEDLPSDLGIVIKKWRLFPVKTATFPNVSPSEFRWQDEITLLHRPLLRYDSSAFVTEHFHRNFYLGAVQGANTLRLDSASRLSVGDTLYLGPSSHVDFDEVEEEIIVGGISGNDVSFSKSGGLEASYDAGDPVDFNKAIWIFNEHSFSGTEDNVGTLQRFSWPDKQRTLVAQGHKYSLVAAADFDDTTISFVRADQIMDLDITSPTLDLGSSLEANLRESDRKTYIEVFDLISDRGGNVYYKLQQKETTDDGSSTADYGDVYNFQTISSVGFVNSVALSFDQRFTPPVGAGDTIEVRAQVRDQFNFPAFNKQVQFSATADPGSPGGFYPIQSGTNINGIASTTYTPSVTLDETMVEIKATVL